MGQSHGLERWEGHKKGVDAVRTAMEAAGEIGVKVFDFICFFDRELESSEERDRRVDGVDGGRYFG